ncbi:hypothetical protein ABZ639_02085 [Saccharomonospora sp. NPDC006951]
MPGPPGEAGQPPFPQPGQAGRPGPPGQPVPPGQAGGQPGQFGHYAQPVPAPAHARGGTGGSAPSRSLLVAALCVLATALTVAGSFVPLFSGELSLRGTRQLSIGITAWGFDTDAPAQEGGVAVNGVPLVFAALLLLVAAALVVFTARGGARRGAGAVSVAGAAAFLAGTVWTVGMQAASWVDTFRPTGDAAGDSDVGVDAGLSAGMWLLIAAAVLALAGAALALLPSGKRVEPVTPRYGFPAQQAPQQPWEAGLHRATPPPPPPRYPAGPDEGKGQASQGQPPHG